MNSDSLIHRTLSLDRTDLWSSGPFVALATAFIFASSSIAGKYASVELAALTIILIRSILATGFLGGVAAKQGSAKFRISIRHFLPICLMGWFGIVGYVYLFLSSLQHTTVANTAIIGSLAPVASAVAAAVFIGEKLSLRSYLGVLLAVGGVVLLLSGGELQRVVEVSFNRGDLLMLLAAWLFAEPITPISALSAMLIACGLYFTLIKGA